MHNISIACTYKVIICRHRELLNLSRHGSHVRLHRVHPRKLTHGGIGGVHLRVTGHIVHGPGTGVGTVGSVLGRVDVPHHTVARGDHW